MKESQGNRIINESVKYLFIFRYFQWLTKFDRYIFYIFRKSKIVLENNYPMISLTLLGVLVVPSYFRTCRLLGLTLDTSITIFGVTCSTLKISIIIFRKFKKFETI